MPSKREKQKLERAKIFLPYDTLKGLREALREKEKVIVNKKLLSEDEKRVLSDKLKQVQKKRLIKVIYYDGEEYVELEGLVSKVDLEYEHCLYIKKQRINFSDLLDISADYIDIESNYIEKR